MTTNRPALVGALVFLALGAAHCRAVELRVSRQALERTLQQQLFNGPNGRYKREMNANPGSMRMAPRSNLADRLDRCSLLGSAGIIIHRIGRNRPVSNP